MLVDRLDVVFLCSFFGLWPEYGDVGGVENLLLCYYFIQLETTC